MQGFASNPTRCLSLHRTWCDSTSSALSRSVWMEPTRHMLAPFERLRRSVVVSDSLTVAPGPAWALASAPLKLSHLSGGKRLD